MPSEWDTSEREGGGKDTEIEDIAAQCGPSPGLIYIASHKLYLNGGRSQFVIISHAYSIYTIPYSIYHIWTMLGMHVTYNQRASYQMAQKPVRVAKWQVAAHRQ